MAFSAVRVKRITSISQLQGQSRHAMREDEISQKRLREGAEAGKCLVWSKAPDITLKGVVDDPRDLLAAYKEHKKETGAGERKGAPLTLQALCVVSPEWIRETGDLHDKDNPRNVALFNAAKAWAEEWAGQGSVIASRLDLDEVGGGVVDLCISPVRLSRGKPKISTNKPLQELKIATGERNEWAGLQTSWAAYAAKHLDPNIQRGIRKEITKIDHVSPETYGHMKDKARAEVQAELKAKIAEAEQLFEKATNLNEDVELFKRDKQKNIRKNELERLPHGRAIIAARIAHDKALENLSKERNRIIQFAQNLYEACSDVINTSQELRQRALNIAVAYGVRLQKEWRWFRESVLKQIRD